MATVLRWLTRTFVALAALCLALAAWSLAEQAYYRAAAHALSSSVRTHPRVRPDEAAASIHSEARGSIIDGPTVESGVPTGPSVTHTPGLIGEIDVPHLGIAAAVVEGDDAAALRRGAGHLRRTAMPGGAGNVVLAGHRDTVFRRLGELQRGDRLRLTTARGVFHYRVARTLLVRPEETWVLRPDAAALTLITCYPFNWIGTAPQRWIVQAEAIADLDDAATGR